MKCSGCGATPILGEKYCGECGTPRSELHPQFEKTEQQYVQLKTLMRAGGINQTDYEKALRELVIQDESGQHWMIGAESEQWHRFDGQEWQREDPPVAPKPSTAQVRPSPRAEAAPRAAAPSPPAETQEPAPSVPPMAAASRSRRWLLPLGGCLLGLVLLCGVGLAFRQPLSNALVNLAVDQGWGTVVEPTEAGLSQQTIPTMPPGANQPVATTVIASPVPPTRAPTEIPTVMAAEPAAAWTPWSFPRAGIDISVPPGFITKPQNEGLVFLVDQAQTTALAIEYREASAGTTFQMAMMLWMAQLENVTMGPLPSETPVGKMVFAVTQSANGPVFYAMVGPTRDNSLIYLTGTAPEGDWQGAQELFIKITKEIEYSR